MTDLEWLEALDAADRRASVWAAAQVARSVLHLVEEPEREAWLLGVPDELERWVSGGPLPEECESIGWGRSAEWVLHWSTRLPRVGAEEWHWIAWNHAHAVLGSSDDRNNHAPAANLVRPLRWPLTTPTTLHAAPEAVQVAWDRVADCRADHTMADLVEAHARAQRLGLLWADPAQRAVAERAQDEDAVRAILAGRAA